MMFYHGPYIKITKPERAEDPVYDQSRFCHDDALSSGGAIILLPRVLMPGIVRPLLLADFERPAFRSMTDHIRKAEIAAFERAYAVDIEFLRENPKLRLNVTWGEVPLHWIGSQTWFVEEGQVRSGDVLKAYLDGERQKRRIVDVVSSYFSRSKASGRRWPDPKVQAEIEALAEKMYPGAGLTRNSFGHAVESVQKRADKLADKLRARQR